MKTDLLQKIKFILLIYIINILSSCSSDLTYSVRGNPRVNITNYSKYQNKNLSKFTNNKRYQRLVNGKSLKKKYYIYMRPYGGYKKLRLPRYNNN